MGLDWSQLSAPQAAVLAAAIGIVSAVIGQFAGAVLNAVVASKQAAKNRQMESEKVTRQLNAERERRTAELRREAFVEFQTAAHDLHSMTLARASTTNEQAFAALSRLQGALTRVQLVTQSEKVMQAVHEVKQSVEREIAGQHSDYAAEMGRSLEAMRADLSDQFMTPSKDVTHTKAK